MKKINRIFCGFVFFANTFLCGEIIETAHFDEIVNYVKPNTLILVDIDDTLLIPVQTVGTDVWFCHRVKQHQEKGLSFTDALEKAIQEWEAVRKITDVAMVEEGSDAIIDRLQLDNVQMMGLTTQGLSLSSCKVKHLLDLNIDLSKTAPHDEDCYFQNERGVLYYKGVLFTAGTPKGRAMLNFLDLIDCHPDHILFINDKLKHLKDVEEAVEARNIAFTGLRYSYCDERVNSFREEIGDIQWKFSFEHILTDKEAEMIWDQEHGN
jgi:hypothetical protein